MVLGTYAAKFNLLKVEIKTRIKIAVFMVLLWQFTRFVVFPIGNNVVFLSVLYGLLEISSMVVIYRFTGNSSVGKDVNELNLYALIMHILAIPLYYLTTIPLEIYSYSIWGLFTLAICRLFYFGEALNGEYKGIPSFSLLVRMQKKATGFNHWSELLFFGSAIPIWYTIYQTNDSSIVISSVGLMIFIYLISDVISTQVVSAQKVSADQAKLNIDEASLLKLFNEKSVAGKAAILRFAADDSTAAGVALSDAPTVNKKRELVHSLLDSYYTTHPQAKNILVAVNWYFARAFPRNRDHNSLTLTERRLDWLMQVKELMFLGRDINKNKDLYTWDDFSRFQATFADIFPGKVDTPEAIRNGIEYARHIGGLNASDSQIILAADVLISAWFQLILKADEDYLALYPELEQASTNFIASNLPAGDKNTSPFD